jgi:hypothetical protein
MAMFPDVNALPGAEGHTAAADGNGEVDGGQGGADVSGHVVVAFGGVDEHAVAVGDEAGEESFEVAADVGIGVFLDEQRGGGVTEVEGQKAVLKAFLGEPVRNVVGDFVEAAAAGLDAKFVERLEHGRAESGFLERMVKA